MLTFYGPVWIVLFITMTLYAITGRNIFRNQARNKRMQKDMSDCSSDIRTITSHASRDLGTLTKNTQISQTSEAMPQETSDVVSNSSVSGAEGRPSFSSGLNASGSSNQQPKSIPIQIIQFGDDQFDSGTQSPPQSGNIPLVTTTVTTVSHGERVQAAIALATPITPRMNAKLNRGARVYAQVAFLLYVVMLVVWVPSTVNRAYSLAQPDKVNFGLNLAASIVLPLQGFFNAFIYIFTSRKELMKIYRKVTGRVRPDDDGQIREVALESITDSVTRPGSPTHAELVDYGDSTPWYKEDSVQSGKSEDHTPSDVEASYNLEAVRSHGDFIDRVIKYHQRTGAFG
jgi:hypothetical protein